VNNIRNHFVFGSVADKNIIDNSPEKPEAGLLNIAKSQGELIIMSLGLSQNSGALFDRKLIQAPAPFDTVVP
jgi:hypothetical protein